MQSEFLDFDGVLKDNQLKPVKKFITILQVVVVLLFYVHGKQLRSCWEGELTYAYFSWADLDLLSS